MIWQNKRIRFVLLGKKHINGASFTEIYDLSADAIGDVSLADAIREALRQIESITEIPAFLVEGIEFRLLPDKLTTATPCANAEKLYDTLKPFDTEENFQFGLRKNSPSLPPETTERILLRLKDAGFSWDTLIQIDEKLYAYLPSKKAVCIAWILRRLRNGFPAELQAL